MSTLSTVFRYEVGLFVGGLALLVTYQLLTGKVNVNGLLREKHGDRGFSPGRLQLLVFTVVGAIYYMLLLLEDPKTFPDIPEGLLLVLGGSNSIYLAGKVYAPFRNRIDSLLSRTQTERRG
jgi:hypothetical protein